MSTLIRAGLALSLGLVVVLPATAQAKTADKKVKRTKKTKKAKKKKGRMVITLADGSSKPKPAKGITIASTPRDFVRPAAKRRGGQVLFSVRNKDINDVLEIIEKQVGVKVTYRGLPKRLSLRLTQPVTWEAALDLVQQFSGTHLHRDHRGRLQLRPRFGGKVNKSKHDDLDGQIEKQRRRSVLASSKRRSRRARRRGKRRGKIFRLPPRRGVPKVQIGTVRPMRFGPSNPRTPHLGPRRTGGAAKVGVKNPRRTPQRGPRAPRSPRRGAKRPMPGF